MKLAVVGPGLIGRSIILAARRSQPNLDVIEVDRDQPIGRVTGADIIVLATPVDVILDTLRIHADVLRNSVAIDTGSTKKAIVAAARQAKLDHFIGGHPMAGAATSGPSGARADLFDRRRWFLVPHGGAPGALKRAQVFVRELGASPVVMEDDGSEHDRLMAAVSHLPQIVASVLMTVAGEAAGPRLDWGGNGLRDTTRLAHSRGEVWQSILRTNASELRPLLQALADQLRAVAEDLDDAAVIRDLFAKANHYRALL